MKQKSHKALFNYNDNLIYVGQPSKIMHSYTLVLSLLQDLGLEVSQSKLVAPSTEDICLGILVNTAEKNSIIPFR